MYVFNFYIFEIDSNIITDYSSFYVCLKLQIYLKKSKIIIQCMFTIAISIIRIHKATVKLEKVSQNST